MINLQKKPFKRYSGSNRGSQERSNPHKKPPDHSRYSIFVYGCSSTVYRMSSSEEERYKTYLEKSGLYMEHPRTNEASLRALHCFTPLLNLSAGIKWSEKGGIKID